MARRAITIDEKIKRAEAAVIKAKDKYESAVNEQKELQEKKRSSKVNSSWKPSAKATAPMRKSLNSLDQKDKQKGQS